jgi:hypothetical protein
MDWFGNLTGEIHVLPDRRIARSDAQGHVFVMHGVFFFFRMRKSDPYTMGMGQNPGT